MPPEATGLLRTAPLSRRIWLLFSVIGPGIIAANADNDASGILGYSQAGAAYGYEMLWVLVLSTVALGVSQEIGARMGAVTGKGLADLIRENFGVRVTFFAMIALLVANFATIISEFAGILAAIEMFSGPAVRFVALPLMAAGIWFLVARGTYKRLERILLGLSLVYLLYIGSALLAHPNWHIVLRQTFLPSFRNISPVHAYVFMIINVVGTTITPWGQFYIQSSVRDKGIAAKQYSLLRADVLFGAFFTNFIAFFIIVCCGATLYAHGIHVVNDAGQAAKALAPLAGGLAAVFFGVGLFNASCFGAIVLPISTAYSITEALGWESGLGRRVREAPLFIGIFTAMIAGAALLVMAAPVHLLAWLIILPNIVGGALLPIILVLTLILVNKRRVMGKFTNGPLYNIIAWATTIIMVGLSLVLLATSVFPSLG